MRFELTLAFLVAVAQAADDATCAAEAKLVNETFRCRDAEYMVCAKRYECTDEDTDCWTTDNKKSLLEACDTAEKRDAEMAKQPKKDSLNCTGLLKLTNDSANGTCNADYTKCTDKDGEEGNAAEPLLAACG